MMMKAQLGPYKFAKNSMASQQVCQQVKMDPAWPEISSSLADVLRMNSERMRSVGLLSTGIEKEASKVIRNYDRCLSKYRNIAK